MVNISKRKLSEDKLLKMYQLFFQIIIHTYSKDSFMSLIRDIFTPSEQIMIVKRITILYLLLENIDQRSISNTLKVSTTTVAKYAVLYVNKNTHIIKLIKSILKKEKMTSFLKEIFMDIYVQPGVQKGHHKIWYDYAQKKTMKKLTGL